MFKVCFKTNRITVHRPSSRILYSFCCWFKTNIFNTAGLTRLDQLSFDVYLSLPALFLVHHFPQRVLFSMFVEYSTCKHVALSDGRGVKLRFWSYVVPRRANYDIETFASRQPFRVTTPRVENKQMIIRTIPETKKGICFLFVS